MIQKLFHTDKWWGKVFFIIITYVIFWFLFYGILLLIPEDTFVGYENLSSLLLIYIFVFVPAISLFLISYVRKVVFIKHHYLLNTLLITLSLILFLVLDFYKSTESWFSF